MELTETEIGPLPTDWPVVTLGSLSPFVTSGSRGWAEYYAEHGDAFIRITNLTRSSIKLDLEDLRYVRLPRAAREGTRTQLRDRDVLISITADIGIAACVSPTVPQPAYINQHIALVRFDPSVADGRFVAHYLASGPAQRVFRSMTDTGAKAGMNLDAIQDLKIPLPSIAEQHAIAICLTDADELIEDLDAVTRKQVDVLTSITHDLTAARRRLDGFRETWTPTALSMIGSTFGGLSGKVKGDFGAGDARYVPFLNIIRNATIDLSDLPAVRVRRGEVQNPVRKGDLLLNGSSETPGEVGLCSLFAETVKDVYLNSFSFGFRPTGLVPVDGQYLAYALRGPVGRRLLFSLAQGSTRYNLSKTAFLALVVELPSLREQQAIAEVLTDAHAAVRASEAVEDKAREMKVAMAQELLSGRTRLA